MDCLLDTCTFLFMITNQQALSKEAERLLFDDASVRIYLSEMSLLELVGLSRKAKAVPASDKIRAFAETWVERYNIKLIPIDAETIWQTAYLPWHHTDPFDRYLIATAVLHKLTLLSPDTDLPPYKSAKLKVAW
jgi:PIN domain nuclease of toxin-antitoxin system